MPSSTAVLPGDGRAVNGDHFIPSVLIPKRAPHLDILRRLNGNSGRQRLVVRTVEQADRAKTILQELSRQMGLEPERRELFFEILRLPLYQSGVKSPGEVDEILGKARKVLGEHGARSQLIDTVPCEEKQLEELEALIQKKLTLSALAQLFERRELFPRHRLPFVITLLDNMARGAGSNGAPIISQGDLRQLSSLLDDDESIPAEARQVLAATLIGEKLSRALKHSLPNMLEEGQNELARSMLAETLQVYVPNVADQVNGLLKNYPAASLEAKQLLVQILVAHGEELTYHEIEAMLEVAVRDFPLGAEQRGAPLMLVRARDQQNGRTGPKAHQSVLTPGCVRGPRLDLFSLSQTGNYLEGMYERLTRPERKAVADQGVAQKFAELEAQEHKVLAFLRSRDTASRSEIVQGASLNGTALNSTLGRLVERGLVLGEEGYGDVRFRAAPSAAPLPESGELSDAEKVALLFRRLGYTDAFVMISPDETPGGIGIRWDLYYRDTRLH